MIIPLIIVAAVLLVLLGVWTVRVNVREPRELEQLQSVTEPVVDIAAFRNLMDPSEEEFLRANLTAQLFRTVQRQRMLAAVEYVQSAAGQARMLLRLVEGTRDPSTGELPQIGEELVAAAIRFRALSILVLMSLYLRIAFPGLRMSPMRMPDMYEHVVGLGQLARVKPAVRRDVLTAAG